MSTSSRSSKSTADHKPSVGQLGQNPAPAATGPLESSRVDAAHSSRLAPRSDPYAVEIDSSASQEEPAPWSALTPNDSAHQRQARELAERLRDVQRRLDARESELNSRHAQLDAEARRIRLQEKERNIELAELESTRSRLLQELESRSQALAAAEHSNHQELTRSEERLKDQQAELDRDRSKLLAERRRLQKQAELLHHSQQGLENARSDTGQQWLRLQQEFQLEATASQLQHARLLKQAERAADEVHEKQKRLEARAQQVIRDEQNQSQRHRSLDARQDDLQQRERQLDSLQVSSEKTRRENEQQALALQQEATELDAKAQSLERSLAELEEREAKVQATATTLQRQQRSWRLVSLDLDQQRADLDEFRQRHESQLSGAWSKLRSKLQSVREEQQQWSVEQQRARKRLEFRERQLEQRQGALIKLRAELRRLHFETLEIRLATEELLACRLGPEDAALRMAQVLPRVRQKIADHFHDEIELLSRKKAEIHELLGELRTQRNDAQRERKGVQQWFERRRREIEEEAARLIARQHELNQQSNAMRRQSADWAEERLLLQQKLRELSRQRAE